MKAFGYFKGHLIENFDLRELSVEPLPLNDLDVLVKVKAVSLNPVDTKIRMNRSSEKDPVILGWDASGIIEKVGAGVKKFKAGDKVYYAGNLNRPGSNAEFQTVDSRIIAHMPSTLSFSEAAALPLTSLTAWEGLFERGISFNDKTNVLIYGGAGGVGSIATQLLKLKTKANVITTASRPETREWSKKMGADIIVDHSKDIAEQLKSHGIQNVDVIYSTTNSAENMKVATQILRPFGHFILIDDPKTFDIMPLKAKAVSVHWEFMFSKSMFNFNPESQGVILEEVARLVDEGRLKTTAHTVLKGLNLAHLKEGHRIIEKGQAIGKIVITL